MCGVTGFWQFSGDGNSLPQLAAAMADRIVHRGPDDTGTWVDAATGVAFAHRRLSIIDLSKAGHQPMLSASGRWVLCYNGEIYNHLELRRQLAASDRAPAWRGHSDTETLLACIDAWGVEVALEKSVGMFALALWDRSEQRLVLARDRTGEKPMYYGWQGDVFLFGSELRALRAHPAFNAGVDRGALVLLLRHGYVPSPYSIHSDIYKLPPGSWLEVRRDARGAKPRAWWSLADVVERGRSKPFEGNDMEAVDEVERILGAAVARQRLSDVPLGALLSGGVDSSLIAALLQAQSAQPIRTFTVGFEKESHDEAGYAREVARHLGTKHTELRLSASDALSLVPRLAVTYDEPFADSSQLPTQLVMSLARQSVTVALSGDGGDELFGGYNRYMYLPRVWRSLGRMPAALRDSGIALASLMPRLAGSAVGATQPEEKLAKLKRLFATGPRDIDDLFKAAVTEWPDASRAILDGFEPDNLLDSRTEWPKLPDPVSRMMALDALTYLPDDILVKVDRAAMAVSLETRVPFLDRDVVEFAWRLPQTLKVRGGEGKWVLRQVLDRHVPRVLIDRPKMGFGIPVGEWLRGPLREWAEDLLQESRVRQDGYLVPEMVDRMWQAHVRGETNHGHRLWSVLMFQAWLQQQEGAH